MYNQSQLINALFEGSPTPKGDDTGSCQIKDLNSEYTFNMMPLKKKPDSGMYHIKSDEGEFTVILYIS